MMKTTKVHLKDRPLPPSQLFDGIGPDSLGEVIDCLGGKVRSYKKNEYIFVMGGPIDHVGVVISGRVQVLKGDAAGNQNIMGEFSRGDIFGEAIAYSKVTASPVSVLTLEPTEVLLIPRKSLITTCSKACSSHTTLVENLIQIIAKRNLMLNQKIDYLSLRSIREKLIEYLKAHEQTPSRPFNIPLNRNELAGYLCVDRSALSRELGHMRDEGLIEYSKNTFRILLPFS